MAKLSTKFIFVSGGVLSGLGKGITAASIGNILKARSINVNIQKIDQYLNTDAGTLNPAEHGECFVTNDGAETDLDLGHYERFIDQELTQSSSIMNGRVLSKVLADERNGKYLGKTVQLVPHVTKAFQEEILNASKGFDVHIVEIGGTVGDYEGLGLLEAVRELGMRLGKENCVFVHVVYVPYLGASKEFKTKPAQNAVRDLRGVGIVPDVLVVRSEFPAPAKIINKLSMYTGVQPEAVALLPNADTIYEVPLTLEDTGIANVLCKNLGLKAGKPKLDSWREMVHRAKNGFEDKITVGVVAKYMDNHDTYISVFEALYAAAWKNKCKLKIKWIDADKLEQDDSSEISELQGCDGIVVPGGFGKRALEGKIKAVRYALDKKVPYLGLCLGLQMAVVAAARRGGISDATSTELDPNGNNQVINTMNDQKGKENTGGTMRLGGWPCVITKDSKSYKLYKSGKINERHRHRYECNNAYRDSYEKWGLKIVGTSPDGNLVEIVEAIDHPFFVATQFHPEFKSRPNRAHPLFSGFIDASLQNKNN